MLAVAALFRRYAFRFIHTRCCLLMPLLFRFSCCHDDAMLFALRHSHYFALATPMLTLHYCLIFIDTDADYCLHYAAADSSFAVFCQFDVFQMLLTMILRRFRRCCHVAFFFITLMPLRLTMPLFRDGYCRVIFFSPCFDDAT